MTVNDFIEVLESVVADLPPVEVVKEFPPDYQDTYDLGVKHGKADCARFLLAQVKRFVGE